MIEGRSIGACTANPALRAWVSPTVDGWAVEQGWRRLDADRRLQLIEQALRATDGLVDDFTLAL